MSLVCLSEDIIYEINNDRFGINCNYILEEIGFYTIAIDVSEAIIEMRTCYGLICSQLPYNIDCFLGSINYDLKEEGIPSWNRIKVLEFLEEHLKEIFYKITTLRGVII